MKKLLSLVVLMTFTLAFTPQSHAQQASKQVATKEVSKAPTATAEAPATPKKEADASAGTPIAKPAAPTVYALIGQAETFTVVRELLLQNALQLNGKALSAAEVLQLLDWLSKNTVDLELLKADNKKEKTTAAPPGK